MRDHVRTLHYLLGYTTLPGMILLSDAYTHVPCTYMRESMRPRAERP